MTFRSYNNRILVFVLHPVSHFWDHFPRFGRPCRTLISCFSLRSISVRSVERATFLSDTGLMGLSVSSGQLPTCYLAPFTHTGNKTRILHCHLHCLSTEHQQLSQPSARLRPPSYIHHHMNSTIRMGIINMSVYVSHMATLEQGVRGFMQS